MYTAAEELRFEYAAKLRDEIKDLRRELHALAGAPASLPRRSRRLERLGAARERADRGEPPAVGQRQMCVSTAGCVALVRAGRRARRAPRRAGSGAGGRGRARVATTAPRAPVREHLELVPLGDRRPGGRARRRSARRPASTSVASTCARRETGSFRVRQARPTSWWWSATTRSAPGAPRRAAPRRARARASRIRPDWCRHGRTELSADDVQRPRDACTGSVVSHCRSNSRHGCVKRAGEKSGMSWLPGTTRSGGPRLRRKRPRPRAGRPAEVGQVAARDHERRLDPLDELPIARSSAGRRRRSARRNGGRTRGGCGSTPSKQATVSGMAPRLRTRSSTISTSASARAARCASGAAASR